MHEGLRHAEEEHERTREGDGRERQKGGAVAGMHDHDAGKCRRQRGADALRGQNRALRDIVAARAAHQVGHDNRKQGAEESGADAIECLHGHQPELIVGQGIEATTQR